MSATSYPGDATAVVDSAALPNSGAVTLTPLHASTRPLSRAPSPTRSALLTLAWFLAAALMGPLTLGMAIAVTEAAGGNPFWRHDPIAFPAVILAGASLGLPAVFIVAPLVAPLLAVWALAARRWPFIERTGWVLAGTGSLAVLVAFVRFLALDADSRPLAPHGLALLADVLPWGAWIWVALLLPRLVIPPLNLGAFARSSMRGETRNSTHR